MKKRVLLLICLLFLGGCNINVNYEFHENNIKSSLDSTFTLKEYYEELESENDDQSISDEKIYKTLIQDMDSTKVQAFKDTTNEFYERESFNKNNDKYSIKYSYNYNYDNFKNNYILNNCFDKFEYSEDTNYYNYKISGNYLCNKDITLKISADNGIDNSNSIDIKDNVHSWYIFKEDNDIEFSIRKEKQEISSNTFSPLRIVVFVIIILGSITSYVFINMLNKNSSN